MLDMHTPPVRHRRQYLLTPASAWPKARQGVLVATGSTKLGPRAAGVLQGSDLIHNVC
jgi:hypothetical protein